MKTELLIRIQKYVKQVGKWLSDGSNKIKMYVNYLAFAILTSPVKCFASGGDGSETWNTAMDFLLTWVPRLGALMLFGGVIEYAIAYQSDNANQKTQGIRLMVAGGMVMGIPVAIGSLIKI